MTIVDRHVPELLYFRSKQRSTIISCDDSNLPPKHVLVHNRIANPIIVIWFKRQRSDNIHLFKTSQPEIIYSTLEWGMQLHHVFNTVIYCNFIHPFIMQVFQPFIVYFLVAYFLICLTKEVKRVLSQEKLCVNWKKCLL